jgi:hypothetical protein
LRSLVEWREIDGRKRPSYGASRGRTYPGGAQNLATHRSPSKSEEIPTQSQADLDAISVRNALARPSGDDSTASFKGGGRVQANSDALPISAANKLIVELLDKMPVGGEYRASSDSIQKLEYAIKKGGTI